MGDDCNTALNAAERNAIGSGRATKGGATAPLIRYITNLQRSIDNEINNLGGYIASAGTSRNLVLALQQMHYTLGRAKAAGTQCLQDLQAEVRANGTLNSLKWILKNQWSNNMEGKVADCFVLQAAGLAAAVVGLCCEGNADNLHGAAPFAHIFFAALGGCSPKMPLTVIEDIASLVGNLWDNSRSTTLSVVQSHSMVVERAASFLSSAIQDDSDFSQERKEAAVTLLQDWLSCGGRVEKRAARGMVGQLSNEEGDGYFTSTDASVRALGERVARKAIDDPQLVSADDVKNMLEGVNVLILSGPVDNARDKDLVCVAFEDYPGDLNYVDLDGWVSSDDGKQCSLLLEAASKALEYRVVCKGREISRSDYEEAFRTGKGFHTMVPLVQAPANFAEHALRSLAAISQARDSERVEQIVGVSAFSQDVPHNNVEQIVDLGTLQALLGEPSPDAKPSPSYVEQTLTSSVEARRNAARLLAQSLQSKAGLDMVKTSGEKCIKEFVDLSMKLREDGKCNTESFHDMLQVFWIISKNRPGPLCRYISEDMMNVLVVTSNEKDTMPGAYARDILQVLMKNNECKRQLLPILNRDDELHNSTHEYDAERVLRRELRGTPAGRTPAGHRAAMAQID